MPLLESVAAQLRRLALIDFDHQVDGGVVRARQLKEITVLTPWMMGGAVVNCAMLVLHLMANDGPWTVLLWGAAFCAFALFTLAKWRAGLRRPPRASASERAVQRAIRHSALLGLMWGLLPVLVSSTASMGDQALVIITIVGMSASGAFALAVLPAAAVSHLAAMLAPVLIGMATGLVPASLALIVLVLNYFVILTIIIYSRYGEFSERLRDSSRIERQQQTISVLLKDFESSASDWLWETDSEGRLAYVAERLIQVSGMGRSELVGQQMRLVAGEAQNDAAWSEMHEAMRRGLSIKESIVPVQRASGVRWWSLTASPLFDHDGNRIGYRGVGSDVTERRLAQALIEERNASLQSFNQRLEAEVAQRTEEARKAAAEAEEASRAKSRFLATMSHEIRTPMNGILGGAELLARTDLAPRQQRLAVTIQQSAQRLLALVNDILDLSRIQTGKTILEHRPLDLSDCIAASIAQLEEEANNKGLRLKQELAGRLPRNALGDEGRIRQILLNLIGNAIKFTESGSVTVSADCLHDDAGAYRLRFAITDTGIGMSEDTKQRLFVPFEQGDGSITRQHGGTGLGLAISKCLISMMNGWIEVDSEDGKGTTITFEIVLDRCEREAVSADAAAGTRRPSDGSPFRGLRVLVAEDNPVNQEVISEYLTGLGCKLDLVEDGVEAVAAFDRRTFDIVLMDCQMPRMDGMTATRQLRSIEHKRGGRRTPVIAVTANAFESDRAACLAADMDGFLSKPFSPGQLEEHLARWTVDSRTDSRDLVAQV